MIPKKEITSKEIKLIKNALLYVHDKKLDHIKNNRKIMTEKEIDITLVSANIIYELFEKL